MKNHRGSAMAITGTSFTICLLSLATIATADYYSPSSPPVYKKSPSYSPPSAYVPKSTHAPPSAIRPIPPPPLIGSPPPPPIVLSPPPPIGSPPPPPIVRSPPLPTRSPPPPPVVLSPPPPTVLSPPPPPPTGPPLAPPPPPLAPPLPPPPPSTLSPPPSTRPPLAPPPPTRPPRSPPPPTKPYVPEILKAVDGIVLCKNGYESYPILGAKIKIECSEPASYGKSKKVVVIYSDPTDYKGYFYVSLTKIKDIAYCQVKLYTSPVETCKNPTNVNKGLTGVPLSLYGYRYHPDKHLNLFSVGPFYFTGPKAAPPKW